MSTHYGNERIRRGLWHFMLGKGVSSVAGFLAMLLVFRLLSIDDFAGYSVLVALVEIVTAVSGFGLAHVLIRYVPELYSQHLSHALRTLVSGSVLIRTSLLLLATVVAYFMAGGIASLIGLATNVLALQVFFLVVVLRSTTQFLSQILESTLHQGLTQSAFSVAAVVRMLGMAYLLYTGHASLLEVIWAEALADFFSLLIMSYGVVRVVSSVHTDEALIETDQGWLTRNLRTISRFAVAGYLQHLAILPYGGHTNRLIGGHMLNTAAMASFGFALSLYDYVKRYLPAQLLVGMIRPIVVARYCEHKDFSAAARLCGQVVQINILLIGAAFAALAVGGPEAMMWISGDKYGAEAVLILTVLLFVLLLETQRQQLELLTQTVERYKELIPSNVLLSCSVLFALALLPFFGAVAFPAANALGLLFANIWVQRRLAKFGFHFPHDWFSTLCVASILLVTYLFASEVEKVLDLPWFVTTGLALLVYSLLAWWVCGEVIKGFIRVLTGHGEKSLPAIINDSATNKPYIAFGVLSCRQSAAAIDEMAQLLAPHPVLVHHDFSKTPDFKPTAPNVKVLPCPVLTAWGDWSLVEATFSLLQAAQSDPLVTHFQLLSEACMPIRPVHEFERYLQEQRPDVMMDFITLDKDEVLFSHGWRYLGQNHFFLRLGRWASGLVWGKSKHYRSEFSVNLRLPDQGTHLLTGLRQALGKFILRNLFRSSQHVLEHNGLQQFAVGGQWFAVSRPLINWLLSARSQCVTLTRHYQRCHIPDESYVQTLLLNAGLAGLKLRFAPSNHELFWDGCGTGPDALMDKDAGRVFSRGRFFARKFPLETGTALRQKILRHLRPV